MTNSGTFVRRAGLLVCLLLLGIVLLPKTALATEGGGTVYTPGAYGNFGMGTLAAPGFYYNNFSFWYNGSVDKTVVNGRVQVNATENVYANSFQFIGVSSWKILGGSYWGALYLGVADASLNAGATLDVQGETLSRSVSASQFGVSDAYAIPFGLGWKTGNFQFSFFEGVNVPIGEYNMNNLVSISLNHWAFDTNVAANYLDPKTGFTIAADVGYIINTINPATQYQSGQELHIDAIVGKYFTKTFAAGIVDYAYQQTTGDTGSGAVLGPFEGRAYGVGPAIRGIVMAGKTPLVLEADWIHQFDVVNQFQGDYVQVNISFQF